MDKKKTKRRRNTRLILAFFVLLWLALSIRLYLSETGAIKPGSPNAMTSRGRLFLVSVMIEDDGYRYVVGVNDTSDLGFFQFEVSHQWYETPNRVVLMDHWYVSAYNVQLPTDVDRERIFDEGFAVLVAEGHVPNLPIITRAEAEDYQLEYPDRFAKIKWTIAKEVFGVTAFGISILCGFVLVARHILIASRNSPRPGICPDCEYNLKGLDQQQCPECGRAFSDEEWFFHMPG